MLIAEPRPIAQKVLRFLQKCHLQKSAAKVVDLNAFRDIKNWRKELEGHDLSAYDPLHALYTHYTSRCEQRRM